jgi:type 2 lantibiotic biosynthesis protein LanM
MPGTDAMHPVELVETEAPGKNAPRIGDRWLSPDAHIDDVVAGFASFYDFLLEHRDALLTDSPLLLLRGQAVRFVFRATRTYAAIGKRLREPQFLGDGVDYTIELDQLSRPFACTENKPNAWPLLDAELRAMERLDVPLFLTDTSSVDVVVPGSAPSRGYLLEASFDAVVQKLRGLGPNDRERQIAVVEGSLVARAADARASGAVETESPRAVEPRAEIEPLAAALRIAEDLGRRAHHDDDGTPAWLGFGFVASANRYQLDLLGDRLYDGRLGVALFFGALARVTGEASYATRARACLGPVLGWVRDAKHPMHVHAAAKTGLGAATGLGGIVYVLATLAELVGDPTLLDDAAEVARLVTQPAIDADRTYDIFGGAAGAIFGLVKLHRARPDPALLARIAACADHLVDQKVPRPEGGVAWHVEGGPALTGMSHGAAGIALALARAYAATGDTRYRDNALEAIAFETRHYSAEAQNWPDFRAGEHGASCLVQWCHGAAGIALARVATRTALDDAALDADIDAALKTTLAHPLPALDHLCCGSMGLVETLLVGAEHGYGEQLRAAARQKAQTVLARAEADGGHRLFANMPTSIFNPALFSGTAGIGYQLLRLVSSDVPSVLVWG